MASAEGSARRSALQLNSPFVSDQKMLSAFEPADRSATLHLTAREREVLDWVGAGKTNRDIAQILGSCTRTIEKHLERIFSKLRVQTRTAAAMQDPGHELDRNEYSHPMRSIRTNPERFPALAGRNRRQPKAGEPAGSGVTMRLTARECEVLGWLSIGKRNRDIALTLGTSPRTVEKHLERIFVKLGVETRTAAAMRTSEPVGDVKSRPVMKDRRAWHLSGPVDEARSLAPDVVQIRPKREIGLIITDASPVAA